MRRSINRRTTERAARAAAALVAVTSLGVASSVEAAPPSPVDITIDEPFPTATGSVAAGAIPGCTTPSVETASIAVRSAGPWTRFVGTKVFTCVEGKLEIAFSARRLGCAPTNSGRWRIVGATDGLAGAKGGGSLDGSYYGTGSGTGGLCDDLGILDRYTGRIKLPSP